MIIIIGILISIFFFWFIPEKSDSYSEPQEVLSAIDKNLLLIPAYKINDEALFFFINEKNNLGATFVRKGSLGWKAEILTSSPMYKNGGYEHLSGYQVHGENLIYGLIRNGDDRLIKVNENNAVILNLVMLPPSNVREYELEGLYLWYYKGDTILNEGEIELLNINTGEQLDTIDL